MRPVLCSRLNDPLVTPSSMTDDVGSSQNREETRETICPQMVAGQGHVVSELRAEKWQNK